MSAAKDVSNATPLFLPFKYDERVCLACGKPLRYGYKSSGRYIFRLDKLLDVDAQTAYCTNGRCPLVRRTMHPPEELLLAPRGERFGSDVIAAIGIHRFKDGLTRTQIAKRLWDEHHLPISERQVNRYYELYGQLVAAKNLEDPELIKKVKSAGILVLSLDGAKPLTGHDSVWFVRDVISGRMLVSRSMRSTTEDDLVELLKPVKEFAKRNDVIVSGVVSDAEKNIRGAVKLSFPRARHQLCKIHYVNNLSEPLEAADGELRRQLRAPFRDLRELERGISRASRVSGTLSESEASVLDDLCLAIQSILKDNAALPFDPPGLKLYDALVELREAVAQMGREKGGPA